MLLQVSRSGSNSSVLDTSASSLFTEGSSLWIWMPWRSSGRSLCGWILQIILFSSFHIPYFSNLLYPFSILYSKFLTPLKFQNLYFLLFPCFAFPFLSEIAVASTVSVFIIPLIFRWESHTTNSWSEWTEGREMTLMQAGTGFLPCTLRPTATMSKAGTVFYF